MSPTKKTVSPKSPALAEETSPHPGVKTPKVSVEKAPNESEPITPEKRRPELQSTFLQKGGKIERWLKTQKPAVLPLSHR